VTNPFHYGAPATGDHFIGRSAEVQVLLERIRAGVNVVVMSPRRYGKTSLLMRVEELATAARPQAAILSTNVFLCRDMATLAGRLVSGAYQLPGTRWGRARQGIADFVRRFRVRPTVEFDDAGRPRFGFTTALSTTDADALLTDVYALLSSVEGRPAALVLDEFQAITRHGAHLPFLFKGLSDRYPRVSLVLAGSQHHLMDKLVTGEGAPLYGMAQRLSLSPIPSEVWLPFLVSRAAQGGRPMASEAAELIWKLAGPVPNDVAHLAFEAFEASGGRIDPEEVEEGMRRAVDHDSSLFAERTARLSPGQLRVLVALATDEPRQIFSGAFAREVGLASGQSVRKAIDALSEDETVVLREGRWQIGDPFLASWLRQAG
jgi:hypothetical protein